MYINPYQDTENRKWLKANFHTHAGTGPNTCGRHSPEEVIAAYREYGYDALCLSNHNLCRDYSNYSDDKLNLITGSEYTTNEMHMLLLGINESFHTLPYQEAIDRTVENGGIAIINHPNWPGKSTVSDGLLAGLKKYAGIEVFNHTCYRLNGAGTAVDIWDRMLSRGRLITAFAHDDLHLMCEAGRCFDMILSESNSFEDIKSAVYDNRVCASTGLLPVYHILDGDTLRVRAAFPNAGAYPADYRYRFIGPDGVLLKEEIALESSYPLSGEPYVRAEVMGSNGWTILFQPVYQSGVLIRE